MKKKCGIVILNYNSYDLTLDLVNKIVNYNELDEICVVDNNSNDNFDGVFKNKKVKYIKNNINSGYAAGNNIGLRYLVEKKKCDILFIANPDVYFENKTVKCIKDELIKNKELYVLSCVNIEPGNRFTMRYFNFPTFIGTILNCFFLTRKLNKLKTEKTQLKRINHGDKLIYVDAVPGSFFAIKELILGRQAYNLRCDVGILTTCQYNHNHKRKSFQSIKEFNLNNDSLLIYYKKFKILNFFQEKIIKLALKYSSFSYSILFYIYNYLKKVRSNYEK